MKHLKPALLMTVLTTLLLGLLYPLAVTGIAQTFFREKANGQLIQHGGELIGSRLVAQPFTGPQYFHPRPSAAGQFGYDAANSGGSNLAATNHALVERISTDVARLQTEEENGSVPIDLVTTSASGLDPDISPAAALVQVPRVARSRGVAQTQVRELVNRAIQPRFGFVGEQRVNVLELNLALDARYSR